MCVRVHVLLPLLATVRAVRESLKDEHVSGWSKNEAEAKLRQRMADGQPLIDMSTLDRTANKKNWECGHMAEGVENREKIKWPMTKADYLVANYIVESHCPYHKDLCIGCAKHVFHGTASKKCNPGQTCTSDITGKSDDTGAISMAWDFDFKCDGRTKGTVTVLCSDIVDSKWAAWTQGFASALAWFHV
eukprot:CAMPEP_0172654968 /NCGR_PEP_ID=MMETSP1074-20121228/299_1 /TAXON_ID=2916 /ORGANISM="Ceratium fusus, Strain PA161109" /LENGTH=188 /DNA_ID=CAMNT_0013469487 /DNA_START=72 /DNA_END=638 /DNA_ORIENTATION=+